MRTCALSFLTAYALGLGYFAGLFLWALWGLGVLLYAIRDPASS